jgi:dTDP-4-dehydrorhamnose 3,5-epimerase
MTGDTLHGVVVRERDVIANDQGAIQHILRSDDRELYRGFGEAYASVVNPGVVKGWHQHEQQANVLACLSGDILLVLHDARAGSPTHGRTQQVRLAHGEKRRTVLVPPGVVYGWKNQGSSPAILVNCATHPHDPTTSRKIPIDSDEVPYRWE